MEAHVCICMHTQVKLAEWYLPATLNFADLTLATSPQLQQQLRELGCK